jgi:NAD(P)-dependent dehydrogenase (short-subunit alcohol dehydrogenase family)
MMMKQFVDKVALVTGAGSGMGPATALLLADRRPHQWDGLLAQRLHAFRSCARVSRSGGARLKHFPGGRDSVGRGGKPGEGRHLQDGLHGLVPVQILRGRPAEASGPIRGSLATAAAIHRDS